jgi:hypothetical protein
VRKQIAACFICSAASLIAEPAVQRSGWSVTADSDHGSGKIERPRFEQSDRAIQRAGALCSVAGIWVFFAVSRHQGVGLAAILEAAFFVSAAVCVLVIEARRASAPALGLRFAYVAALFVGTFSWLSVLC